MMKIVRLSLCSLIITLAAESAIAAEIRLPKEQEIDVAVNLIMKQQGGVGSAVAVIKDGVPLLMKGYGWANLEHMVPVTADTVFQSGSIAKMFTATGIMMLIRDGKISLDDKLTKFYPEGPEYWQRITIRHLLSHRGGISDINDTGGALAVDFSKGEEKVTAQYQALLTKEYTEDQYAELIGRGKMMFEPGTDYKYSNEAYVLLGFIIHKLSGQFYGDFLAENIFKKIAMKTTQINRNSQIVSNRSQSYEKKGEELTHAAYVSQFLNSTADGSMLFTLKDLLQWENALDKAEILPRSDLQQMYKGYPYPDGSIGIYNYGFGWWTKYIRGHRLEMHSGGWQGFRTCLSRYRDDGLTVVVLANAYTVDSCHISRAVAGLYNPDYAPYTALADQSETRKMKNITLDYLQGKLDRSHFSPSADHDLSDVQIKRNARQVKFDKNDIFELVAKHSSAENTVLTYQIKRKKSFENSRVFFEFDQDGKIVKILFQGM